MSASIIGAFVACGDALAAQCSVSASGVAFGSYRVFASGPADSTGSITVACDTATSYSIAIGPSSMGTFNRALTSGPSRLTYNLHTDASRAAVWGDGTSGTARVYGAGLGAVYTVYGRLPAQQNVPSGSYADTVSVTVEF